MVVADPARCRLWMTDAELAAVASFGRDGAAAAGEPRALLREAFAAAGLLTGGVAPGWVDELLRPVAQPALRVAVETVTVGAPLVHQLWATPRDAVTGEPALEGLTELSWIDPVTIPYTIAQQVRLRRQPPPPEAAAIRLPTSRFAEVEQRLAAGGPATVGQLPHGNGLANGDVDALARIIRERRVTWRVSSVWADGSGDRRNASLSVMDAGGAGLWAITAADPGSEDPMLLLEAVPASTVWRRLVALLPVTTSREEAPA
jgi:hypothetical protein